MTNNVLIFSALVVSQSISWSLIVSWYTDRYKVLALHPISSTAEYTQIINIYQLIVIANSVGTRIFYF